MKKKLFALSGVSDRPRHCGTLGDQPLISLTRRTQGSRIRYPLLWDVNGEDDAEASAIVIGNMRPTQSSGSGVAWLQATISVRRRSRAMLETLTVGAGLAALTPIGGFLSP